jgi:toluene monooxygenase system protein E
MVASYIGQMAPSGRITIAALLQSADELRRIERFAYRLALLRRSEPSFGDDGRDRWLSEPSWQPLRELIERLLVAYDWGEAFVALALCVKPALDELVSIRWAAQLAAAGDDFAPVLGSLAADCRWHREWAVALIRTILDDTPGSRDAIEAWLDRWTAPTLAAVGAIVPLFAVDRDAGFAAVAASHDQVLAQAGLSRGRSGP